jgi:hypothetical protein
MEFLSQWHWQQAEVGGERGVWLISLIHRDARNRPNEEEMAQ